MSDVPGPESLRLASVAKKDMVGGWEGMGANQVGGMKWEMPPMSMAAATTRLTMRLAGC